MPRGTTATQARRQRGRPFTAPKASGRATVAAAARSTSPTTPAGGTPSPRSSTARTRAAPRATGAQTSTSCVTSGIERRGQPHAACAHVSPFASRGSQCPPPSPPPPPPPPPQPMIANSEGVLVIPTYSCTCDHGPSPSPPPPAIPTWGCPEVDNIRNTRTAITAPSCNRVGQFVDPQTGDPVSYAADHGIAPGTIMSKQLCETFYKTMGLSAFPNGGQVRPCVWEEDFPISGGYTVAEKCRTTSNADAEANFRCSPSPPPPRPPPPVPPPPYASPALKLTYRALVLNSNT